MTKIFKKIIDYFNTESEFLVNYNNIIQLINERIVDASDREKLINRVDSILNDINEYTFTKDSLILKDNEKYVFILIFYENYTYLYDANNIDILTPTIKK